MGFLEVTRSLSQGFGVTIIIFAITLAASLPLGLVITFGSMSKIPPLRWITKIFVWIIRGTPLMLQIILIDILRTGSDAFERSFQPNDGCTYRVYHQLLVLFLGNIPRRN